MAFFEDPPSFPGASDVREPQREPWRGTSSDTVGCPVAFAHVLARTEEVAVLISGVVAYPSGFTFNVICIHRQLPAPGDFWDMFGTARHTRSDPGGRPEYLRIGLRFADGSSATNTGANPRLHSHGTSAGGRKLVGRFLSEPLPPVGPLAFVCLWPKFDIAETALTIEADLLRRAAEDAGPIWDADVDLPESPTPRMGKAGWSSYTATHDPG